MGLFSGIKKVLGGVSNILKGVGQIAKAFSGIMNSPLGSLLKMAFPPLNAMSGMLNFASMLGGLGQSVGQGQNY